MPAYTVYRISPRKPKPALWLRLLKWSVVAIVVVISTSAGMVFGWVQRTVAQVQINDPATIVKVQQQHLLNAPMPGQAQSILILGSDRRVGLGPGSRSDTLLLVRLDPATKSISMLSIPRDLRVDIPGYGQDRINAAYTYGGAPLALKTFTELTGIKPNHFIDVNFVGFEKIVDQLGGVYLDVDRRYYNDTAVTGYSSIDLQPGYQKLKGADALGFVRFRHDDLADWGRIQRQQLFVREMKRQALRWSNWRKIPAAIKTIAQNTVSDISSFGKLESLARLVLAVNTSHIYETHVVGDAIVVGGADELSASPEEIHTVVEQFLNPEKPPLAPAVGKKQPLKSFRVYVSNAGAAAGMAANVATGLKALGYQTVVAGDLAPVASTGTLVYASETYLNNARAIAALLPPARVVKVDPQPGTVEGVSVVLGSSYSGQLVQQSSSSSASQAAQPILPGQPQDVSSWRQLAAKTPIKLRMPTTWSTGFTYDWTDSRAYTIPTGHGGNAAAVVVEGTTPKSVYQRWQIEEMKWTNPPAVANPDQERLINGVKYSFFYNGTNLHMVSWVQGRTLYWLTNTLDNALSNELMQAMATSFKPVR